MIGTIVYRITIFVQAIVLPHTQWSLTLSLSLHLHLFLPCFKIPRLNYLIKFSSKFTPFLKLHLNSPIVEIIPFYLISVSYLVPECSCHVLVLAGENKVSVLFAAL